MKEKVAFVCGASSGMGLAVAKEFAKRGCNVFLLARRKKILIKIKNEIKGKFGVDVEFSASDLSKNSLAEKAVKDALHYFGRVDILFINSGGPPPICAIDLKWSHVEPFMKMHLKSSIVLANSVLHCMKKSGWGRIIALTSASTREPIEGLVISNIVRPALTAYLKSLSREVARYGITVNTVAPSYTKTERLDELAAMISKKEKISVKKVFESWSKLMPAGRILKPEEVAAAVAFLASEEASGINGITLPVDGGAGHFLF